MNAKLFLAMLILAAAWRVQAGENQTNYDAAVSPSLKTKWNTDPAYWDKYVGKKSDTAKLQIGKSDYVVSGPLIEGFRRRHDSQDRSLGQKILGLPIVNLFVPQPMPSPPGSGKYFRWGESELPWAEIAQGAAPGKIDNPVTHEANAGLITIHQ